MNLAIVKRFFANLDILRTNRYSVEFHTKFAKFTYDMNFLCKSVSFPFFTFNTIDSFINNKTNHVVNKVDYDPVTFSFYVDAERRILNFIDAWRNSIVDYSHRYGYKDDYVADITITMLHLYDAEVFSCKLINAFLINVDNIDLSLDNKDTVSEVSLSVQYDRIEYNMILDDLRTYLKYIPGANVTNIEF